MEPGGEIFRYVGSACHRSPSGSWVTTGVMEAFLLWQRSNVASSEGSRCNRRGNIRGRRSPSVNPVCTVRLSKLCNWNRKIDDLDPFNSIFRNPTCYHHLLLVTTRVNLC